MNGLYLLLIYLLLINLFTFLLMGMDKSRARAGRRRVPEKRFFTASAIGGALGTWFGMKLWKHKTKHRSFTVGIPYLIAVNLFAIILLGGWLAMRAA